MRLNRLLLPAGLLATAISQVNAAGLELTQHGVKEMGHGFAGTATLLEDASAIAHNPAGLMRLQGTQISGGLSALYAQLEYDVEVITERVEAIYGIPTSRVNGPGRATSKEITPIPHLYFSHRLNDDAAVGIGLYAPFGSGSKFPAGWAGRYHSEETEQTVVNINPTFAFRLSDSWSLGMGVVIQSYDATLTNQIDVGYLVAEAVLEQVVEQQGFDVAADVAGELISKYGSNPDYQVENDIQIDSWSYGFSFGLLWEPSARTRIGLNYRSRTNHLAEGQARRDTLNRPGFQEEFIAQVAADAGLDPDEAAENLAKAFDERGALGGPLNSRVVFPELATLSLHHELSDRLAVMASATYTHWQVFKEIRLEYTDFSDRGGADITETGDDVRRRDLVQPLRFENTWRFGVGAAYKVNNDLTLRTGFSLDESPIKNSDFRTPRGPDADRTIFGLGMSYQVSDKLGLDAAYSYITIDEADVSARENPAGTLHRAQGRSKGTLHNLGLQANYLF